MRLSIAQCCRIGALALVAVTIVALAHHWPELPLPIVSWLLGVALLWRLSREKGT